MITYRDFSSKDKVMDFFKKHRKYSALLNYNNISIENGNVSETYEAYMNQYLDDDSEDVSGFDEFDYLDSIGDYDNNKYYNYLSDEYDEDDHEAYYRHNVDDID